MFIMATIQKRLECLNLPYLVPGPNFFVAPSAAKFVDNFNRADENLEASANWTHDGLIAGGAAVRSNALACLTTNSTGTSYKCPDQGSADHYAQFVARATANSGPFVCNRLADVNNFVGFRNNGATLEVYRRVGGTLSLLNSSAQSIISGTVLRLECTGTNWRVLKDGVQVATGAIGSALLTSTRQGVVARTTTAGQNPWVDDVEFGAL